MSDNKEKTPLKSFFVNFDGMYVGGHAIVTASSEEQARAIIRARLIIEGIDSSTISLSEIDSKTEGVEQFYNGDY